MPLPPAHLRAIFYGTLLQAAGGGADVFAFSLSGAGTGTPATLAPLLLARANTVWTASGSGVAAAAQLGGCRVEEIDATGKVTASFNAASGSNPIGANTLLNVTLVANAVTLETGAVDAKGRKIRGRFYPPANMGTVVGSTVGVSTTIGYNTPWNAFVKGCNTDGLAVAVASQAAGLMVPVTGTTVDTVLDTQRKRKNRVTAQRSPVISV